MIAWCLLVLSSVPFDAPPPPPAAVRLEIERESSGTAWASKSPSLNRRRTNWFGEISVNVGFPPLPGEPFPVPNLGARGELKTLKGALGIGAEVGAVVLVLPEVGAIIQVAPLAPWGWNHLYAGYRFHAIGTPSGPDVPVKSNEVHSFVGGLRIGRVYAEAGRGHWRKRFHDGAVEDRHSWVFSVGYVAEVFGKK